MMIYLGDGIFVDPRRVISIRPVSPTLHDGHRTAVMLAPQMKEIFLVARYRDVVVNYFTSKVYKAVWEEKQPEDPSELFDVIDDVFEKGGKDHVRELTRGAKTGRASKRKK